MRLHLAHSMRGSDLGKAMDDNRFAVFPESLIIHDGYSCLVTDRRGRILGGEEGLFFRNARVLSRLDLKIEGQEPRFISANPSTRTR